jgi:hypothetical protein
MGSVTLAVIVFAVVFIGETIGLELQRRLPESFATGGPRDMTGAVVGLMTLLVALVLGLLICTAYGVHSTQGASVQTLAISNLKLDEAFQDYGADAADQPRAVRRCAEGHRGGRRCRGQPSVAALRRRQWTAI